MKIILREDVDNLGESGQVVTVRDGYARNYLLPRSLAMPASRANMKQLEHERQIIEERNAKRRAEAQSQASEISKVTVRIERKVGEADKLFGAVTALDIAEALAAAGVKIDRRHIHLPEPLKTIGTFAVAVRLHRTVSASITVIVEAAAAA